jgi:phosphatidylserine synthase
MKLNPKIKSIFFQISAILILLAAIAYYFEPIVARYVMTVGVAGFAAVIFTSPYPGKSIRGKRLFNIKIVAVLLMVVSTYLMYIDMNGWVVTLLISAFLILYSTIVLSQVYEKEKEQDKDL